ncbi:hypothetical protein [Dyella sp.]|uniref:hypothetical protein n=1 Tax=Dyella sp. TaxID=1869338 RepID=UPI002FD95EBD
MLKDWLRPFVRPLPQWSPVAINPPSQLISATLRWNGNVADVTADHTVASLNPLTIASSIDTGGHALLEYSDSAMGKTLGVLHLTKTGSIATEQSSVTLYSVLAGEHHCLGWPRRSWNAWLQNRSMIRNSRSNHLNMAPAAAQQLMIAYLYPRPVVLVSVDTPDHRNIFPMDLIGPLERSGLFSLALRSTNVSQAVMRDARQVAFSAIPATMKATVYKLAEHHKTPLQDWSTLSFPVRPSREFAIPVVAQAPRVRELSIVHSQEIGIHTFFLGRISSDESLTSVDQLHHTAGFHQAYRRKRGMPFVEI